MSYSFQTFSIGEVLTAAKMNAVEINIRDHEHGNAGVTGTMGPITGTTGTFSTSVVTPQVTTSTTDLTLTSGAANGNIYLTPTGTGKVRIAGAKIITSDSGSLVIQGTDVTAITITGANTTLSGNLAINTGSSITTDQTAFNLLNTVATTVNAFGAASAALNIGHASGTTTLSGLLSLAQGQIKFPATQNASADANTLDDYEEGTWTPSVGGSATYTTQTGTYTKVGRLVFEEGRLVINVIGTGSPTQISGSPFTAATGTCTMGVVDSATLATAVVSLIVRTSVSSTNLQVVSRTAASASDGANNVFQNGASMSFSGCYQV